MKKSVLVILSLLLLLSPLAAAELNLPYSIDTVISWQYLTAEEKEYMSIIYSGAAAHDAVITFKDGIEKATLSKLIELLCTDFPEILAVERTYGYSASRMTGLVTTLRLQYSMDKATETQLQRELLKSAVAIIEESPSDEYQAELFFHDRICDIVTYSSNLEDDMIHTAYNALVVGDAVCDGYSKAMALLCRLKGIRCSVISGMSYNGDTTGFHAWNIMNIKGVYTLSDLTWDDYKEYVRYDYINVTDKEMGIDHMTMYGHIWPQCDSYKVNWHKLNNLYVKKSTDRQLKKLIDAYARFTAETEYTISLRFEDYATFKNFTDNFSTWFNEALKKHGYNIRYWISVNERQQCFSIRKTGEGS